MPRAGRGEVIELSYYDPSAAHKLARMIEDPWFRCQSLAYVALQVKSQPDRLQILQEAFDSGIEADGINRIVKVSTWPLKVLCINGDPIELSSHVRRLLELADQEPSPVRRADALEYVVGAIISAPRELFMEAFERFKEACSAPLLKGKRNKRGESMLVWWAVMLKNSDPQLSAELSSLVRGPTYKKQLSQKLAENVNRKLEDYGPGPSIGHDYD